MDIIFKKAYTDDVLLIQQLAKTIWHSHYPGIIAVEQIEYMLEKMYSAPIILSEIENGFQWTLIFEGDQPIGFIEYHFEKETQSVKLSKLYLLTQYHKKGIGQKALQFVKKQAYALRAQKLYLTVNKENSKALEAYKKAGFIVEKEVCADIGNGFVMDDYIMSYKFSTDEFCL